MTSIGTDSNKYIVQNDTGNVLNQDYDPTKLKTKSGRYDWDGYINKVIIKPILRAKLQEHILVTIRGLCYILETMGVIPKTDFLKAYRAMATARKNGTIHRRYFVDNTRHIIKDFDDNYVSVDQRIKNAVNAIENLPKVAKSWIPRWYRQPWYIEDWVEKDAFANLVHQVLNGHEVVVAPNKGWSSITFMHENIDRIAEKMHYYQDQGIKINVQIFYFGDLDPSGWAMDKLYRKELEKRFGWRNFNPESENRRVFFKRLGVTKEQISQKGSNLKHLTNPDPEVLAKLKANKNAEAFRAEFGSLFQIELEALESVPGFVNMVRNEHNQLYDQNAYLNVLKLTENNFTENEIKQALIERLKEKFSL